MKPFISQLQPISVRLISACLMTLTLCGISYAQLSGLPINVAASVNGTFITNDMVEQGIQVAISQGQKDSPELRKIVIEKYVEVLLLSQQAEKDGLANRYNYKLLNQSWMQRKLAKIQAKKHQAEASRSEVKEHGISIHGLRKNNAFEWI